MSQISKIADSIDFKIQKLVALNSDLKLTINKINEDLIIEKQNHAKTKALLENNMKQLEHLKYSNALLGSEEYKRETKLKINALIREIDSCIVQLNK